MSKADRRLVTGDVHQQWPHVRHFRERAASSHPPSRTPGTLSPYKHQVQQKTSGCRLGLDRGDKRKQRGTAQAHRLWHSSGFGPPCTQQCQATLKCLGSKYEETVGHQVSEESWQQETKTNGKVTYKQEMTREAAKTFKKSN